MPKKVSDPVAAKAARQLAYVARQRQGGAMRLQLLLDAESAAQLLRLQRAGETRPSLIRRALAALEASDGAA